MNWTPQIPLKFDGRGSRLYFPGETLAGSYFLDELGDEPIEAVEVSVLWHTEGKGNEDFGIHEFWRRSVTDGDWIDNRTPGRFSTTLPNSPLSYDGELIKIFWSVRIRVFMSDDHQIVDEHPFRLGNIANIRTMRMTHEKSPVTENVPATVAPLDEEGSSSQTPSKSPSAPDSVASNSPSAPDSVASKSPSAPDSATPNSPSAPDSVASKSPSAPDSVASNSPSAPDSVTSNSPSAPDSTAPNSPSAPDSVAPQSPSAPDSTAPNSPSASNSPSTPEEF